MFVCCCFFAGFFFFFFFFLFFFFFQVKCCQYWPTEGKAHFGKISIKHLSSSRSPDFSVNELKIRKVSYNIY